ncbi:uncharacterized protein L969DRAFT_89116 [Mixia osmundae IAM 14324]|nr:uncharacterized protein L969DRAFT_89116 [Mixia osmundae IAM 14324]KEI37875.1 hypothetical protein L969DRAFT_89116 [Mixia osmundae IAM 14324]
MASTAGVRVSPLQLGAMSIGEAWSEAMGSMNKEQSFKLLDAFVDAGGNMIDTANNYQNGESELWIGEWMKERKNRDLMVIATKFTTGYVNFEVSDPQRVNFTGNSRRSLHMSVRDSLKKLQTDWIDVLYIHWWDFTTSIEELMDALHILVQQGKVLYLGISDSPAWIVSAANTYARHHGKTPFSIYQGQWHVGLRDLERDIIPCCRHFGMAIAPWGVLGSGHYQSKKALDERKKAGETLRSFRGADQSEQEIKMSEALAEVAEEHGIESVTAIALAYVFSKYPNVYPIVGGRKVEHLHDNIKALSIQLTDAQVKRLEEVKPFDIGFPTTMIGSDPALDGSHGSFLIANSAKIDYVRTPKPIGHE